VVVDQKSHTKQRYAVWYLKWATTVPWTISKSRDCKWAILWPTQWVTL